MGSKFLERLKNTSLLLVSLLLLLFYLAPVLANDWFTQFTVGAGYTVVGRDQTVTLFTTPVPGLVNRYSPDKQDQLASYFALDGGYNFNLHNRSVLALGVEGAYLDYGNISGIVHPYVNIAPDFDTLKYHYEAQSYLLMTSARLMFMQYQWRPFVYGALGVAWNRLYNYWEEAIAGSSGAPSTYQMRNRTQAAFAYGLGVGVSHNINNNTITIAYRYINAGKGTLGTTVTQETNQHLNSGVLSANLLVISLYFF